MEMMEVSSIVKPKPAPRVVGPGGVGATTRSGGGGGHHHNNHNGMMPARDQDYSSSEGEECVECEDCARNQAAQQVIYGRNTGRRPQHHTGLTADENHISPIEHLDNHRIYSYHSASEGEADPAAEPPRGPPAGVGTGGGRRVPQRRDQWQRRRTSSSPSSSRSSSPERSVHPVTSSSDNNRTMDSSHTRGTLDSSGTGENVYSRINDSATLPLPHMLGQIPPPPPLDEREAGVVPGPAVPPRPAPSVIRAAAANQQPLYGHHHAGTLPVHHSHGGNRVTYHELEQTDFEPQFLRTTIDGNIFLPHADSYAQQQAMMSFPRTVPRQTSLPRNSQRIPTPVNLDPRLTPSDQMFLGQVPLHNQSLDSTGLPPGVNGGVTGVPSSNSSDRQNAALTTTNTSLLAHIPAYPSCHNDFRDYSNFSSATYRMKKKLKSKCTWRCAAITACVAIVVAVILFALLAYCITMLAYGLNWRLQSHPLPTDLTTTAPAGGTGPKGAIIPTSSSVIIVQYPFGKVLEEEIGPHEMWRTQFYLPESSYVKYNFTIASFSVASVYGRRSVQPTHAQHDYMEVLDGTKVGRTPGSSRSRNRRGIGSQTYNTAFVNYMEAGVWYVFIYNDNDQPQTVTFTASQDKHQSAGCERQKGCHGHGDCVDNQCQCYPGFTEWDCSQRVCPVLCSGNGIYVRGSCQCYPGWKGTECATSESECENPTCSGNGMCASGECVCSPGYKGKDCSEADCVPTDCSDHGVCLSGLCHCFGGHRGPACDVPDPSNVSVICVKDCSGHGTFDLASQACMCNPGWFGEDCQLEVCSASCVQGYCHSQRCVCDEGWTGTQCDLRECDKNCNGNGYCDNGTCVCQPGWNGRYCSLDGCPNSCNNHGACQLYLDGWICSCRDGWKGHACDIAMETNCGNGEDDDGDGLSDCLDPDCCMVVECYENEYCNTSPDPAEIILRKQPPSNTASFYERMKFLVEDDSIQNFATMMSFNESQVSVIRGKVLASDGSPLIGVRVSVVTQPLYGFTLTREQGLFDIFVNGGGSVTLQFQRNPFVIKQTTVMVPWNQMVTMDTVTLNFENEVPKKPEICEDVSHDPYNLRPVVISTWQHTQLGACPSQSAVIAESQVLQESLRIPGTSIYLVYHSSQAPGYMSTILIQLTPGRIPPALAVLHLRVSVEGLVYERAFEADVNVKYTYAWDRRNAYNQKVYGIVTAHVHVGYQYVDCSTIFWSTQAATMSGYDITSSEIGKWNLHMHHIYNFKEGILHRGDGTNIYLKERPRKIVTILGTGRQRRLDCRNCDGEADSSRLMAPVALASGRDGSLYIGDFNYIRKMSGGGVATVLELQMPEVPYKYFMTVSPLDGRLYISDYMTRQIIRIKTMGPVRELGSNHEVIAGNGQQCYPGDTDQCGDEGRALDAKLFYPKGIAINKDGVVYFADGANIRLIDRDGTMKTVVGSQAQPRQWAPMPCQGTVAVDQVTLHWPTALAINPLDDTLHILDNNMVLKLTRDHRSILVVAGHPLHCPPINPQAESLFDDDDEKSAPKIATSVILKSPQHITFSQTAKMFIVESDGKLVNRIRVVDTDGTISHYAGMMKSPCDCTLPDCVCYNKKVELATKALLNNPTAITVTPDNVLHVADMGNLRIHSIVSTLPTKISGRYEIIQPETQELFVFNQYGQHIFTKNLVTNQFVYNFTYHVNSYYGTLVKITDNAGNQLQIKRDYSMHAKEIVPPGGEKCSFSMDNMGQLHSFTAADNDTTTFTYLSDTGLVESKKTTKGLVYIYDYNENGRLAHVIQPTGERTAIETDVDSTGALARIDTKNTDKVAMATNGNLLSILHEKVPTGKSHIHVSYLQDGSLIVQYPFNMAVTMETSPHPLLSTEHQLQVKRKVMLPEHVQHRLEWRYYLRKDRLDGGSRAVSRVGRRLRVGSTRHVRIGDLSSPASLHDNNNNNNAAVLSPTANGGYEGKMLMVNGVTILAVEYDRDTNSESVYNVDKEEILLLQYNNAGQLIQSIPSGTVQGVNITYNHRGQMVKWTRANSNVEFVYDDKSGQMVEKRYGSRGLYRYLYKGSTKPSDVIIPSGKQYVMQYDNYGNLKSIATPSLAHHKFHSMANLGLFRLVYHTPEGHGQYIMDYDSNGKLKQEFYPSGYRRITYYYSTDGLLKSMFYDWTDVQYGYYPENLILHSINVTERAGVNYECGLVFSPAEILPRQQNILFKSSNLALVNARFTYLYDSNLRIASIEALIGSHLFPAFNYTYDVNDGKLLKLKDITFEYPRIDKEIIRDANLELVRQYDSLGHETDVWFKFNNHVEFTLNVKYDSLNRLQQWRRKVRSNDLKAYEYVYDIDSNLIEVIENGQQTWRYDIDENSNIEKITIHSKQRQFEINNKNQIETDGEESYIFDKDGYLIQRGSEVFEYNSRGLLFHAFQPGKYDLYYFYDGLGRLTVRQDVLSSYLTQYYYADIYHKDRITHIYEFSTNEVSVLHYDDKGKLFAMQRNQDWYYIALDPVGSPLVIFNSIGSVVRQTVYDPLGGVVSSSPVDFIFDLGFQCGIQDPVTKLVFLNNRVYDPSTGRWTIPDYRGFVNKISDVWDDPEMTNHYLNKGIVNRKQVHELALMTDISSWLSAVGYNMAALIPAVDFSGQLVGSSFSPARGIQRLVPITSAFECAFKRDMAFLSSISTVPASQITVGSKESGGNVASFEPLKPVFGQDILLSVKGDKVIVDLLERPDENLALIASTLLNSSDIVDVHFTIHGRDVHYFVKSTLDEAQNDAKTLALKPEGETISGMNVTIHRHHKTPDKMLHADYRLHGSHTVYNIRYGTSVAEERDRVLTHAIDRAISNAWLVERELVQSNKQSINIWTREQRQELLSKGSVDNVQAEVIRDVSRYPELADDPKNIRFMVGR